MSKKTRPKGARELGALFPGKIHRLFFRIICKFMTRRDAELVQRLRQVDGKMQRGKMRELATGLGNWQKARGRDRV